MPEDDGRWPGYCREHAAACEKYARDLGPFPGCPDCERKPDFDISTQFHLHRAAFPDQYAEPD